MLTQEKLKELLGYNLLTGEFTWKVSRGGNKAGSTAGTVNTLPTGYCCIHIRIDRKIYKAHRLAFLWMFGHIPDQIDHINHNASDNRWINLRPANSSINRKNSPLYSSNTSGCTGVYWYKRNSKWKTAIRVNGKLIHLGYYDDIEDAIKARKAANIKYGFHENHGKNI